MQSPNYAQYEFLSAANLNAAAGAVSGSFAQLLSGSFAPGLIHPEVATLAVSGLVATVSLPLPFQVAFGSGVLAAASGTTTGSTTTTYTANFSGTVPASGSANTAYLLVSYTSIQEGPYQVVGPPPGHPDYNPLFVPTTAYALNVDSVNVTASLTAPDNSTTFELARATVASGATTVVLNTAYQQRASSLPASQIIQVSGSVILTPLTHGGKTVVFTASGITATLWPAASGNGVNVEFISTVSGTCTIAASGSDLIYGSVLGSPLGESTLSITQGSAIQLLSLLSRWQLQSESISNTTSPPVQYTYVNTSQTIAPGVYLVDTSGGSITLTLELAPTNGDNYTFFDFAGTWGTYPTIIAGNGNTINKSASNLYLNETGIGESLAWQSSATNWRLL